VHRCCQAFKFAEWVILHYQALRLILEESETVCDARREYDTATTSRNCTLQ
jgi:hypothetical protein